MTISVGRGNLQIRGAESRRDFGRWGCASLEAQQHWISVLRTRQERGLYSVSRGGRGECWNAENFGDEKIIGDEGNSTG